MAKKREYIHSLFPDAGFLDYARPPVMYDKPAGLRKGLRQVVYRFSCHSFRHFYSNHISKNPEIAQQILRHEKMDTTLQYRKEADIVSIETKLANELFNEKFLEAINNPSENVVAVWDELKKY